MYFYSKWISFSFFWLWGMLKFENHCSKLKKNEALRFKEFWVPGENDEISYADARGKKIPGRRNSDCKLNEHAQFVQEQHSGSGSRRAEWGK